MYEPGKYPFSLAKRKLQMIERIHWPIVFVSFCIGIAFVYFSQPQPEVITFQPNPDRVADTVYEDADGECYQYEAHKAECQASG